ncbi:MAG: sigma 54-interacting transcriptional regulator [Deltaproteobacteria bacterium]|nr:sigma 54-interacting transcriptional regulator [Deltaproteobacteria bacterium]
MDEETESRAEEVRVSRPRFTYADARGPQKIAVTAPTTICGSSSEAKLFIDDRTVSRIHAELELRDDGVWVRDLGSTNGSYVNGVRIERARVPDRATLRFGGVECSVEYEQARRPGAWPHGSFGPLLGESAVMRELFAALARAAPTTSSILVRGETGTGKELVARAIHEASPRAAGPFVVVDCAALPETLLDAELFGHAKGAFTGADRARAGAFEEAEGGTLFLDEIGELPLSMQPKLLRVLEARTVRRLGETQPRAVDVRVVAATHRDLGKMAACGGFREDLFFRLAVLPIRTPSLRERTDDIPMLLERFLGAAPTSVLTETELGRAIKLPWLGNVRELRNFAERARAFGGAEALRMVDAERGVTESAPPPPPIDPGAEVVDPSLESYATFRERWIDRGERLYVEKLLAMHDGNVANAARACGLGRAHLYRLIKRHAL